jgi:DNA-binding response OmpR family regulator
VEDEELVRAILCETLTEAGYTVIQGRNAEHALALVLAHRQPVHLLLTDIVMPRMNGCELAGKIRSLLPGLQVLYISGHSDRIPTLDAEFLRKPFTPDELLAKVRDVCDRPDSMAAGLMTLAAHLAAEAGPGAPGSVSPL